MLRRLGILGVLLLGLSGFIPTAWACAVMAQLSDCCPDHRPCPTEQAPVAVGLNSAACCNAQSTPTRAFTSVNVQKEDAATAVPNLDHWVNVGELQLRTDRMQRMRAPITFNPLSESDQQQLYLQTGRLRL